MPWTSRLWSRSASKREATRADLSRPAISIVKACALVGVSRRTIYNWLDAGKIEYVRTAGGQVRIFTDSLFRGPHGERMEP